MNIRLGAKVYSSDDQQVGMLSHVILFPGTKELTHLVVQKGQEAGNQKLIPVDTVFSADEKRVVLQQTSQDWAQGSEYHSGGNLSVESQVQSAQSPATAGNPPEGTVALKEGAKVVTADGQNMGVLERFTTTGNRLSDVFFTKGKLLKSRKIIQAEMISTILEDELRLNVDSEFINSLPEPRSSDAQTV